MAVRTESASRYQDTICDGPQQLAAGTATALHHGLLIHCTAEGVPLHIRVVVDNFKRLDGFCILLVSLSSHKSGSTVKNPYGSSILWNSVIDFAMTKSSKFLSLNESRSTVIHLE